MRNKKMTFVIFIMIIISLFILIFANKDKINNQDKRVESKKEDYTNKIKPLSKDNAVKILKAEYGDFINISEKDIQIVGDEYVVDVYMGEIDEEDHKHEDGEERVSLGTHKINIYTGELIFPE